MAFEDGERDLPPEQRITRYIRALTDEVLEKELLSSTPKGVVAERELLLDFSELANADFHTAGRLLGAAEGFLRRGGSVAITPPPIRATVDEARILGTPLSQSAPAAARKHQSERARLVQDRSRATRFLQRIGFLEAALCGHLVDARVTVQGEAVLAEAGASEGVRAKPSARGERGQLLEVVPYRWLPIGNEGQFLLAVQHTDAALSQIGVLPRLRQAVYELAQNVREHSLHGGPELAAGGGQHMLFGVATRELHGSRVLEILVVDGGVSIPTTLSRSFKARAGRRGTQSEVLAHAFEPNSTRKSRSQVEGSARGLAVVLNAVRNAGGEMTVRSGTGEVHLRNGVLAVSHDRRGAQPGTAFLISVPLESSQSRAIHLDGDVIGASRLDIEAYVLRLDGVTEPLVSLGPASPPASHEPTVVFVEPGVSRVNLEEMLVRHVLANATVIVAATDGQGAQLRDQAETILSARPLGAASRLIILERMEPIVVSGAIEPRTARGLVRAVIERFAEFLVHEISETVVRVPVEPRRTWSLEIVDRWVEPRQLHASLTTQVLTPLVLAFRVAQQIAGSEVSELAIHDVIVTDRELTEAGHAVAGWLGATHVRRIRIPQEPDIALLTDEIEAASVILTPIIHGGGATVPIIRGLLASGRRFVTVCCDLDGRADIQSGLVVAGHVVPVVSAAHYADRPAEEAIASIEAEALNVVSDALADDGIEADVFRAVASSPGALSLGHFHSENRAWMSAVITPHSIGDPSTPIGRLILKRLVEGVLEEVGAISPDALLRVQHLGEPTRLTAYVREALERAQQGRATVGQAVVLVDWGALTGETVVRGVLAAAQEGPAAVIAAVGVDRSFQGAHHLLRRSAISVAVPPDGQLPGTSDELESRQVGLSFVSAAKFARDHRSEIDCPLCATERSLLRVRTMSKSMLNSRLRLLRVRTSGDTPRTETVDAFDCEMTEEDVSAFLTWRSILHRGVDDRALAHGVALRLECEAEGLSPSDLIALARNLVLNPDLLKRRPWSSPRFRHSLGEALYVFLLSRDGLSISSDMARQLVTVLRMASKGTFARRAGDIHRHWQAADVREELEVCLATMLSGNVSNGLLDSVTSALTEFEQSWQADEPSTTLGTLKAEVIRITSQRQGDPARRSRWRNASELLSVLPTHMGVGGATVRLPILVGLLNETEAPASREILVSSICRQLNELQRFIELVYPSVIALLDEEYSALVLRGIADPFPDQQGWASATRELTDEFQRAALQPTGNVDLQGPLKHVLAPLDVRPGSLTFAAVAMSAESDLASAIEQAKESTFSTVFVGSLDRSAKVLFPLVPLIDLIGHLIDNAVKHHTDGAPTAEVSFQTLGPEDDPVHRRLRVYYRNTAGLGERNQSGGLSVDQWGGAMRAFGGRIEPVDNVPEADFSFALDLYFQRPWGDTT